ncbi:MAG TPA: hypothetical protein VFZ61_27195 [Polyangiales bacterium]
MSTIRPGAAALACLVLSAVGCDDEMDGDKEVVDAAVDRVRDAGAEPSEDDQIPPMGRDALEAWLADGVYNAWHCEPKPHLARSPSPHGYNRICANDAIADNIAGTDDWPKGAAAVKELYASADSSEIIGYAVYLKTEDDSAGGDNWYWYERLPLDNPAPQDDKGVVADGLGDQGPEKTICVGCHVAAGADPAHTPSAGGRDQVYTPVK